MILRDYMYLDTNRLQDYMSSLDSGTVEKLTEIQRSQSAGEAKGGVNIPSIFEAGGGGSHERETTQQRSMRITAQNMFSRVYEALDNGNNIKVFDEDSVLPFGEVRRREVVEITRTFSPSPMNDLIDNLLRLMDTMRGMGFVEEVNDPEMQQVVQALAMIFRGEEGREEVPMVARVGQDSQSEGDSAVVFLAKSQFILVDQGDFEGEMTVFGKVNKLVPAGHSLDLFDFIKLPRTFARQGNIKKDLLEMFESWPAEFGGPIAKESLEVAGPVIIVTPVAVYEA